MVYNEDEYRVTGLESPPTLYNTKEVDGTTLISL